MLLGLIGFVEKESDDREIKKVIIRLEDKEGNHFIDEEDIKRLISNHYTDSIRGKRYEEVNLKELEDRIYKNKFVEKVEVYKDHKGNLMADVTQWRALARIVQQSGPHAYIGENGNILPISSKYTARVVIVDGERAGKFLDSAFQVSAEAKAFVNLLRYIEKDPFLKAQVSQITYKKNGDLLIHSQVGDEIVEFGKADQVEEKFNKYKIYYKKILPAKGYNRYKRVNLKYKEQIICE
jgi:cell division protein FtsQ